MGARIEVFCDESESSKKVLEKVMQSACPKCEVMIYELSDPRIAAQSADMFDVYGITTLPVVILNGKKVDINSLK